MIASFALSLAGCDLLKVENSESAVGRGAKVIDPYQSSKSGAIRLALQSFKGCAIYADGRPVSKAPDVNIPYPDTCTSFIDMYPGPPPAIPPQPTPLNLVADTKYFLDELTFMDALVSPTGNAADEVAPTQWMTSQSLFSALDWSGLLVQGRQWEPQDFGDKTWSYEISYGNANWMTADWSFRVELLDAAGTVRQTVTYNRKDFLAENATSGHTRVSWKANLVSPPSAPNSTTLTPSQNTFYSTNVRVDLVTSTHPPSDDQLLVPSTLGNGAIRVTWNQMPDRPFYFPITVVRASDLPASCSKDDGTPTPCGFGIDPEVKLSKPQNGKFYAPGEAFSFFVDIKDDNGNNLHSQSQLPSFADLASGSGNGLIYFTPPMSDLFQELNSQPAYQVVGPIDELNKPVDPNSQTLPYYSMVPHNFGLLADPGASYAFFPGLADVRWSTRYDTAIPPDAKPGTYLALLKVNRQFMGERTVRTNAIRFQVGTETVSSFPNQVGNCQICHRGAISLENVRHGLSVDNVEACVACHADGVNNITRKIHQIHYLSDKYPMAKNDCTVCHLTRQSALRPSFDTCSSCHPSVHGGAYFTTEFALGGPGNRYSNCAQTCHVATSPKLHVLPN